MQMTKQEIETNVGSMVAQMSEYYGLPEIICRFGAFGDRFYVQWNGDNAAMLSVPYPEKPDEKWFLLLGFSICDFLLKKHFERPATSPV